MINFSQSANNKNILSAEEAKNLGQQIESHEISKNIAIYTMPERFRAVGAGPAKAKSAGFLVLLVGLVLLFLIIGSFYYYFFILKGGHSFSFLPGQSSSRQLSPAEQKNADKNQAGKGQASPENNKENNKQNPAAAKKSPPKIDSAISKAKERYFQFEQSLPAVNTLTAYEQLMKEYAWADFLSQFEQQKEKISQLSESDQVQFFQLLASQQPAYSQLKQNLKADKLSSTKVKLFWPAGKGPGSQPVIEMEKNNNRWLIAKRQGFYFVLPSGATTTLAEWLAKKTAANQASAAPNNPQSWQPAPDADNDNLSDMAEKLLGTNINNPDTDQDGYNDYQELLHLYNPAGKGRLAENPLLATYTNKTFAFSFLYPAQWNAQKVDGDQSVIFKTANDQFFQVVVQPNADNQTITAWYQKQFNVSAIKSSQFISGAGPDGANHWQGIKTEDGLTAYITPAKQDIILTITYSPGANNTLYFSAIMDMILASLNFSG